MRPLALAVALAAAFALTAGAQTTVPREPPYSCRLLYDEEKKCGFDPHCDKRVLERLNNECLRDGG